MKRTLLIQIAVSILLSVLPILTSAQTSVGINTATPNQNAVLELVSPGNNQGVLITRLNDIERANLGKKLGLTESGLMIFNTSDTMFYFWSGKVWQKGLADLSYLYNISSILTDSSTSYYNGIRNLSFNTETNTFDISVIKSDMKLLKTTVDNLIADQNLATLLTKGNEANNKITKLNAPTDALDAANKQYVDVSIKGFRDTVKTTFKNASFVLGKNKMYVGDANDTARAVSMNGHVVIVDITGKTEIQQGVIKSSYLAADLSGNSLPNGIANHILTSNGDGTFKWTNLSTTPIDPKNIVLTEGMLFVGNASNNAEEVAKNTIPLSGFANATANISIGDGVTNYKITNLLNPTANQDAATKKYVDDSLKVIKTTFKNASFVLEKNKMYVGDANDTARAVSMNGHVAIVDATGKTEIQSGVIRATHLGSDLTGASLTNGTANHLLTSNGDGTFKWTNLSTTPIDPINIELTQGTLFVGNASNKAEEVAKNTIPLSGFDNATANISLGDGVTNYKITNLLDPTENQDAATKKYVDDSLKVIKTTFKNASFVLGMNKIYVGDANDTARAVTLNGHVAIVDATGKTEIQPGVIRATNLGATLAGATLTNGTTDHILTSNGDGTFKWTNPSTTPVDPNNITLNQGYFFIGNNLNKAQEASKNTIPISGFSNATTNVSIGDGVTNFKITNVLNPVADQDAATKKYVDDSLVIHNTGIKKNASDIAGLTTKLNITSLTTGAVPYWNATKFVDSKIWSNGSKIMIGGNDPSLSSGYTYDCEINGTFKTQKIYHSSDERWKKDIKVLDSALAKVLMMNGVQYNWRRDEFPNKNFPEGLQIGLIAQQIEKIAPELVATDNDGYKAVEYANMVAFLIEAIKEQQKIIDDQQKEIKDAELKNDSFEKRLEALEKASAKKK